MKSQHVEPEEAVQIHMDIQAKHHWSHYLDPPARLCEATVNHGLNPDLFFTLHHGVSRVINHEDMHSSS
uniref:Uncharacterized protein n=1 Tax=Cyprinus carpio TaxID=7962 RepID=A0A8C1BWV0_CYPCA